MKALCHSVIVMKEGHMVEAGRADDILNNPRQAYTRELIQAAFEDGRFSDQGNQAW